MAEAAAPQPSSEAARRIEEAGFLNECAINASWVGARLAISGLAMLFGAFLFAYFYLRSINAHGMWYPASFTGPRQWSGALIMALVVASALIQTLVLQRLKAGNKSIWLAGAIVALALGLAAVGVQLWQLNTEPFWPASSGFASVFTGATAVLVAVLFCMMVWLEKLIAATRHIPTMSFVEQPPTYEATFTVQRFQARLSAFTLTWNFIAVVALVFWILFYLVH
jgi:heme/copper-type cytochrome/quinol oxidase subunit 3